MDKDNNLDFLEKKNNLLFTQIDQEKRQEHQEVLEQSDHKDFIAELPEWDLIPPNETVKRVVR